MIWPLLPTRLRSKNQRVIIEPDFDPLSEAPGAPGRSATAPATLAIDWQQRPLPEGVVRARLWPTRALNTPERWFDELSVWTEGVQPSTQQRARLQMNALRKAFALIELEQVERVGVTLSLGTVERFLEYVTGIFEQNLLFSHRIAVVMRGDIGRLRSQYRVMTFVQWLRERQVPVGYRLTSLKNGGEMRSVNFLQPDFAELRAPELSREEIWSDTLLEARAAGLHPEWLIVSGLDTERQLQLARAAGFRFGQGAAVRPPYEPPSTRRLRALQRVPDMRSAARRRALQRVVVNAPAP